MNPPREERVGEGVMSYVQCRLGGYVKSFGFKNSILARRIQRFPLT